MRRTKIHHRTLMTMQISYYGFCIDVWIVCGVPWSAVDSIGKIFDDVDFVVSAAALTPPALMIGIACDNKLIVTKMRGCRCQWKPLKL